jgi:hypothetical protein
LGAGPTFNPCCLVGSLRSPEAGAAGITYSLGTRPWGARSDSQFSAFAARKRMASRRRIVLASGSAGATPRLTRYGHRRRGTDARRSYCFRSQRPVSASQTQSVNNRFRSGKSASPLTKKSKRSQSSSPGHLPFHACRRASFGSKCKHPSACQPQWYCEKLASGHRCGFLPASAGLFARLCRGLREALSGAHAHQRHRVGARHRAAWRNRRTSFGWVFVGGRLATDAHLLGRRFVCADCRGGHFTAGVSQHSRRVGI